MDDITAPVNESNNASHSTTESLSSGANQTSGGGRSGNFSGGGGGRGRRGSGRGRGGGDGFHRDRGPPPSRDRDHHDSHESGDSHPRENQHNREDRGDHQRRGGPRSDHGHRPEYSRDSRDGHDRRPPRGGGRGGRGGFDGSRGGGGARPRRPPFRDEPEERPNTLVIKDADNEFLRMLKAANEDPRAKVGTKEEVDELFNQKEKQQQQQQQRRGSSSNRDPRQFVHMQPSRITKADPDRPHKACPVCLMDAPSLTGELVQAVTSCEHIYCFECALRLIFITNKEDCPICRQKLRKVVLTRVESLDESKEVREFVTSEATGGALKQDKFKQFDRQVYYDCRDGSMEIFELAKQLLWFNCAFCSHLVTPHSYRMTTKNQTAFDAIARHLNKHHRNMCDLCFFNLELFPYEYELYTDYELDQHKRLGSAVGDAQVQHKKCHLCPTPGYYFNNEALANHCKEAHISCYVCNSQTIFFIDHASLVAHVSAHHIVCPVCRRSGGQTMGFLSVIELRSHAAVEHPGDRIDYEALAKEAIATATAQAYYGGFADGGAQSVDMENMSRREAFDEIDNLLRHKYSAERHLTQPSFNPKTENYIVNFPSIGGLNGSGGPGQDGGGGGHSGGGAHTNINLFPASKYRMATGKITGTMYEEEFPGLAGPSSKSGGKSKSGGGGGTIASVAASMKFKPQNWSQPNQLHSKPAAAPAAVNTGKGKKGKAQRLPASASSVSSFINPVERDLDDAPASIYDDMVNINPLDGPSTMGSTKPKAVQLIEAPLSTSSNGNAFQRAPPSIDAFPSLGRPAPANTSTGAHLGSSNWSKAAAAPKPKPQKKKTAPAKPSLESQLQQQMDLKDGGSFPELAIRSGPSLMSGGGGYWGTAPTNQKKKKQQNRQTPDSNEWYRPNGANADGTADEEEDCDSGDNPYITHLSTNDREADLRRKVRQQLTARAKGNDTEASEGFNAFKELSLNYRNGDCTPDRFFELGRDLLGGDFFDAVICDLISLLPNIRRQTALYRRLQADPKIAKARGSQLYQCDQCGQLTVPAEKAEHLRSHQKNNGVNATKRR